MAEINGDAHTIKIYNLPQHAAIKIHGFEDPSYDLPKDAVLLFDRLEGMDAYCVVEGTKNEISINGDTSIVELGGDEYRVEEAEPREDKSY
jgi:hypothetical protein